MQTQPLNNGANIQTLFQWHSYTTRGLNEGNDVIEGYDFSRIQKIVVNDVSTVFLVQSETNGNEYLMGLFDDATGEIPYLLKISQNADGTSIISNEIGEKLMDASYNQSNNIYTLHSYADNDVIAGATRSAKPNDGETTQDKKSAAGFICNVGIEGICAYSCYACGITAGWSIVVGLCGCVAAYIVCP